MSTLLDRMEACAMQGNYKDPERIDEITTRLLDLRLVVPAKGRQRYLRLTNEIATGFELNPDQVMCCSVRELLILIGFEPGMPFFCFPEDDVIDYEKMTDKKDCVVNHCYALMRVLMETEKKHSDIGDFFRIDYNAFYDLISERLREKERSCRGSKEKRDLQERERQLKRIRSETEEYVRWLFSYESDQVITIGDLFSGIDRVGSSGWGCGLESAREYLNRVIRIYQMTREFFMDGLLMNMIPSKWRAFRATLEKCEYDPRIYEKINFADCFD